MKPISEDERADLDTILVEHGYRPDDFYATAEEDPVPSRAPVVQYVIRSTVTVRRESTAQERQYRDLPLSAWLIEGFQHDLEAGLFGRP